MLLPNAVAGLQHDWVQFATYLAHACAWLPTYHCIQLAAEESHLVLAKLLPSCTRMPDKLSPSALVTSRESRQDDAETKRHVCDFN